MWQLHPWLSSCILVREDFSPKKPQCVDRKHNLTPRSCNRSKQQSWISVYAVPQAENVSFRHLTVSWELPSYFCSCSRISLLHLRIFIFISGFLNCSCLVLTSRLKDQKDFLGRMCFSTSWQRLSKGFRQTQLHQNPSQCHSPHLVMVTWTILEEQSDPIFKVLGWKLPCHNPYSHM